METDIITLSPFNFEEYKINLHANEKIFKTLKFLFIIFIIENNTDTVNKESIQELTKY